MGKRGNGEGSITRRKDGRWWGRHTVHTSEGPKQRAVYGKTRADVAAKLRKVMSEADVGLVFDSGSVTVSQYLDGWLSDCVLPLVEAGKLEHSTHVRYAGIVRNHLVPSIGKRKLKDLGRPEVRRLATVPAGTRFDRRQRVADGPRPCGGGEPPRVLPGLFSEPPAQVRIGRQS